MFGINGYLPRKQINSTNTKYTLEKQKDQRDYQNFLSIDVEIVSDLTVRNWCFFLLDI